MEETFRVKLECQNCGETWEEEAFINEDGETELVDEHGGWLCPECDLDGDAEIIESFRIE